MFREGYKNLLDANRINIRLEDRNYNYYRRIQEQEVKETLKRMSNDKGLRKETQVTENQFDFLPRRLTMKAMYLLRVMEQYRMYQKDLHLVFIDLESACDKVPCKIL
ncbi:hypothetical protein MTR_6g047760 [Medicago truncatula]|uniref:Reverse transcriptase domain-containing protein n=1 Tax=Medicago truncatula TaxID=3880 RepID=A0A072UK45_MEDTR|nr:hypothetical protein MTR_6g047760 [Medicago truncatula]